MQLTARRPMVSEAQGPATVGGTPGVKYVLLEPENTCRIAAISHSQPLSAAGMMSHATIYVARTGTTAVAKHKNTTISRISVGSMS